MADNETKIHKPQNLKFSKDLLENSIGFFNNPNLNSRLEQTTITLVTAWTHLLIAIYKKNDFEYEEYKEKKKKGRSRKKYVKSIWALISGLVDKSKDEDYVPIFENLKIFIELRDMAIHKSNLKKTDEREITPYLQTCVNNFLHVLKKEFDDCMNLDFTIPISLSVNFDELPRENCMVRKIIQSQKNLNADILDSTFFCKKVAIFIGDIKNNKNKSDMIIKKISVDEEVGDQDQAILSIKRFNDTEVFKLKPGEVCKKFKKSTGYELSISYAHSNLVKNYKNDNYYIVDPLDNKKRYSESWVKFLINEYKDHNSIFIKNCKR